VTSVWRTQPSGSGYPSFFNFAFLELFEDREREAAPAFSEKMVESHLRYDPLNSQYGC